MESAQGITPSFYALWTLLLLIVVAALWMTIDSQRRKRRILKADYNVPVEPLSLYAVIGASFSIVAVLGYMYGVVPFVPHFFVTAALLVRPLILVVLVVYLTRVVFDPRVKTYYEHYQMRKQESLDNERDD